jgi:glucokinase
VATIPYVLTPAPDGTDTALGLDIGGTKLAAGVMTATGDLVSFLRCPTPDGRRPPDVLRELFRLGHAAVSKAALGEPGIVGIGCGGPVDTATGVVDQPPNLPGWSRVPVTTLTEAEFGRPVRLENDAVAAVLGEYHYGSGQGANTFAYLTVSTGVGGAIMIDGQPIRGRSGNGGEIGHMIVIHNGRPCNCGSAGCLEAYVSGTSIAGIAAEGLARGVLSILPADPTAADVSRAAAAGDVFAAGVWDDAVGILGSGLATLSNIFEPELIVLGGGVTRAGDQLLRPVREHVKQVPFCADTDVRISQFGDTVGVVGAAAAAFQAAKRGDIDA